MYIQDIGTHLQVCTAPKSGYRKILCEGIATACHLADMCVYPHRE
jgi:hypothetical protein